MQVGIASDVTRLTTVLLMPDTRDLEAKREADFKVGDGQGGGDHHRREWPCAGGRGRIASGLR